MVVVAVEHTPHVDAEVEGDMDNAAAAASSSVIISENDFVKVFSVRLPAGTVGIDIKFRNESKEPPRIEVGAVRGHASDIEIGDVLIASGGFSLPNRASALELEEYMNEVESLGETRAVEVILWRNKYRFHSQEDESGLAGDEVLVPLTKHERSYDILWTAIEVAELLYEADDAKSDRHVYALARGPPSRRGEWHTRSFELGLILVGINHEPVPDIVGLSELQRRLEQHETTGPVLLNMWRMRHRKLNAYLFRRCQTAATETPMRQPVAVCPNDCQQDGLCVPKGFCDFSPCMSAAVCDGIPPADLA